MMPLAKITPKNYTPGVRNEGGNAQGINKSNHICSGGSDNLARVIQKLFTEFVPTFVWAIIDKLDINTKSVITTAAKMLSHLSRLIFVSPINMNIPNRKDLGVV